MSRRSKGLLGVGVGLGALLLLTGGWPELSQRRLFGLDAPIAIRHALASDQHTSSIYQVNIDSGDLTSLAVGLDQNWQLFLSPDGQRVAAIAPQDDQAQVHLYVMNIDGTQRQQLAPEFTGVTSLSWSPNGQQLAIVEQDDRVAGMPYTYRLYVLDLEDHGEATLLQSAEPDSTTAPAWSPDGQRLFYACLGPNYLCTITRDGQNRQVFELGGSTRFPRSLQWSPDGQKVVYTVSLGADSYVIVNDTAGENVVSLSDTTQSASDDDPAWSPDGQRLAFVSEGTIFAINADGTNPISLAGGNHPLWSPNGDQLAFRTVDGIWRVSADGTGLTLLIDAAILPAMVESFIWSADGQHLIMVTAP
ncbi:MAG: PD40 domain-containing protein [Leptolyngbya sp. SIO1E4]|nr:PD40 domain-containing protein [Leptolyngbya sp. SIO1E4]